jgi:hypothetical protein
VYGNIKKFQEDPYWKDYILFYEYFHGDTGAGVGASHQTGWTGTIAKTMQLFSTISMEDSIKLNKEKIQQIAKKPVTSEKKVKKTATKDKPKK